MIPKIIWQTHEKEYKDLFKFQKNIVGTWKNLNPTWDYRYVDANQRAVDVKGYSEILYKYYNASDNFHRSDIWRLVALYTHGGFYADMDSVCTMPIDEMLQNGYKGQELICSPEGFQHTGINSSNFGVVKNSKIIKSIIDSLLLQYDKIKIEDFPKLDFAFPENHTFSEIAKTHKDFIFFNHDYFSHSKDYKTVFNYDNHVITFNGEKVNYKVFCKNNNFSLYI